MAWVEVLEQIWLKQQQNNQTYHLDLLQLDLAGLSCEMIFLPQAKWLQRRLSYPRHILTAAHCVEKGERLWVHIGDHDKTIDTEGRSKRSAILNPSPYSHTRLLLIFFQGLHIIICNRLSKVHFFGAPKTSAQKFCANKMDQTIKNIQKGPKKRFLLNKLCILCSKTQVLSKFARPYGHTF